MSILINDGTRVLIQGITGAEGSRACVDMLSYGTKVIAGVTPGKGGQKVSGVPVYNTIFEALTKYPEINCSLIMVPAHFAKDAAYEAIAAGIPLVSILTERIPTFDTANILARAKKQGVRVIGPSSIGIISPGHAKIGAIGLEGMSRVYSRGPIGLISKSGGMTSEIALTLTRAGLGQSTALGIGSDLLIGSSFSDVLELFARDPETLGVVIFGEVGGTAEERAADFIRAGGFKKPLVALIAGEFGQFLPSGTTLGHAGAIVSQGRGGYASKVRALQTAGAYVVQTVDEIPPLLKKLLHQY